MVTINDLSNIIDTDVLHELYTARDLTLSEMTEEDKRNIKKLNSKEKIEYENLLSIIKNIPNVSDDLLNSIKEKIESHVDNNAKISAYFDEKLYKCRCY